jgi:hypothetical protein
VPYVTVLPGWPGEAALMLLLAELPDLSVPD